MLFKYERTEFEWQTKKQGQNPRITNTIYPTWNDKITNYVWENTTHGNAVANTFPVFFRIHLLNFMWYKIYYIILKY